MGVVSMVDFICLAFFQKTEEFMMGVKGRRRRRRSCGKSEVGEGSRGKNSLFTSLIIGQYILNLPFIMFIHIRFYPLHHCIKHSRTEERGDKAESKAHNEPERGEEAFFTESEDGSEA